MEENNEEFSAENSLHLINAVLERTKERYEQNGNNITLWGLVILVAGIVGFSLIITGNEDKAGWPWLLVVPMFVYTMISESGKGNKTKNYHVVDFVWMIAGIFAMITCFLFRIKLGSAFPTMLYLPFCLAAFVTALVFKKKVFILLAVISSVLAYLALLIPEDYQMLLAAVLALLLFLIPGLILKSDYKRRQ